MRRRPWDHGKRFALPWAEEERTASYFVRGAAGACPDELAARAARFTGRCPAPRRLPQPATPWPPVDAAGFLSLQELGAVPADISALLPAAR